MPCTSKRWLKTTAILSLSRMLNRPTLNSYAPPLIPLHPSVGGDLLAEILKQTVCLSDLCSCALVHRRWRPIANACLYRHVHLLSRHDVVYFWECLSVASFGTHNQLHRASLVNTLHVALIDPSREVRAESENREAYRRLGNILGRLTNLTRMLMEVHIALKWHEYNWMQALSAHMPESLKVFMVRVRSIHSKMTSPS